MTMPLELEKMMFGFIESQVLFVCDEYKIFDYFNDHGGATCSMVGVDLGLSAGALERLFIAATSIGLIEKKADKYFICEKWKPYLIRSSPNYCGGKFTHYFKTSYKIFEYLTDAIKENKPQWEKINPGGAFVFDQVENVYQSIYKDPLSSKEFLNTMWASGYNDSIELCKKFSFPNHYKLVDLGGASGSFSIAAIQQNPQLNAQIMDFSEVKPYAEEMFIKYQLENRISFHIGNMFKDELISADIYSIGYVLSDLPEDICLSLIKKVYDSLPPGGLIVILEKFFNEDKSGPYLTAMLNITMLLEMHGSHRAVSEYSEWLINAGFIDLQVVYSSGEKHMIIGRK